MERVSYNSSLCQEHLTNTKLAAVVPQTEINIMKPHKSVQMDLAFSLISLMEVIKKAAI